MGSSAALPGSPVAPALPERAAGHRALLPGAWGRQDHPLPPSSLPWALGPRPFHELDIDGCSEWPLALKMKAGSSSSFGAPCPRGPRAVATSPNPLSSRVPARTPDETLFLSLQRGFGEAGAEVRTRFIWRFFFSARGRGQLQRAPAKGQPLLCRAGRGTAAEHGAPPGGPSS